MTNDTEQGVATAEEEGTLLEQIVTKGNMAREESQVDHAKDLIGEFVSQVLDESMTINADTVAMITQRIAQIDDLLSKQLNEIMHDEEFQTLEASWRGLNYLVMNLSLIHI